MRDQIVKDYCSCVSDGCQKALQSGKASILDILPVSVFRNLEPVSNERFTTGMLPMILSLRNIYTEFGDKHVQIPRKISFANAVYFFEGLIKPLAFQKQLTIVHIGDSNSDKRLSYNIAVLAAATDYPVHVFNFICNPDLIDQQFGPDGQVVCHGLNRLPAHDNLTYYHAKEWNELATFSDYITKENTDKIMLCDIDGTLLLPKFTNKPLAIFIDIRHDALFNVTTKELELTVDREKLDRVLKEVAATPLCVFYDDWDFTMLVVLAVYFQYVRIEDLLQRNESGFGFDNPWEFFDYVNYVVYQKQLAGLSYPTLDRLFEVMRRRIREGTCSPFSEYREEENRVLLEYAESNKLHLNGILIKFILTQAESGWPTFGYSDLPNSSLGLKSDQNRSQTCSPIRIGSAATSEGVLI